MTHAQKATQEIREKYYDNDEFLPSDKTISEIIQTEAIKPALDEATRELKELVVKQSQLLHRCLAHVPANAISVADFDAGKPFDECLTVTQIRKSITAAEKLLEK